METRTTVDLNLDDFAPAASSCPFCGGDGFLIGHDNAEMQCEARDGRGQIQPSDQAA